MNRYIDTTGFNLKREGTAEKAVRELAELDSKTLAQIAVNHILNEFIARENSRDTTTDATLTTESPVPYTGWFWRSIDLFDSSATSIARAEDGITAFCQSNKWDLDERDISDEELAHFRMLVWSAYQASGKGGRLDQIIAETQTKLTEAGDFIRGLVVT